MTFKMGVSPRELLEGLLQRITIGPGGCWVWRGSLITGGYAQVKIGHRRKQAHIAMYEATKGPVPAGLELDHLCRIRHCINPDHLEPVAHAENVRRGILAEVSRLKALAITHCRNGHEYTPENTHLQPSPTLSGYSRVCLECRRQQNKVRHPKGKPPLRTECRHGHPYDEENTYHHGNKRYCRTCDRLAARQKRGKDVVHCQ